MKDFLGEYKKEKTLGNVSIIAISLVLAFGINFFILDGTDIGKNLKASILDINNIENKADFFVENNGNSIYIKNSKDLLEPTSISLSFVYSPEILDISELRTNIGELAVMGEEGTGNDTIIINLNGMNDVSANSTILEIDVTRKLEQSTQMNLVNANFTDASNTVYDLSTSGITF